MSSSDSTRRLATESAGLPDWDDFDQYVTQADVDRDRFAIALFEVKPIDLDHSDLLVRLGQTLLQFASPTAQIAYLGRNRFGLLSHTDDTTHRWVAPVTTALRVTLDCWWVEESSYETAVADAGSNSAPRHSSADRALNGSDQNMAHMDVSDLTDRPTLMAGVARGLSREVWTNAEQALAKAYKQQIPVAEYLLSDSLQQPEIDRGQDVEANIEPATTLSGNLTGKTKPALPTDPIPATDERLVVLSRRIEPVDRPEPIWHWLRLIPGLRARPERSASPIRLNTLSVSDQALIEVWLANQVADLFANASAQLRISIPLSAEACKARSFAQRIFPLLERYRVPPSRLVVEVDMSVISSVDSLTADALLPPSAPSVERFIRDAAAVNVAVAVTGFNGGWSAWHNLGDLPVSYVIPSPEMIFQASQGDHGSIRSLVLLAAESDERGIELIAPQTESGLSEHALTQLGFTYGEGTLGEASEALPVPTEQISIAALD